jgi:hypothetical protein
MVRTFLDKESAAFDRIIFCIFLDKDLEIYRELAPAYFPPAEKEKVQSNV